MTTKEIGFQRKIESTNALAEWAKSLIVRDAKEHAIAEEKLKSIRTLEKELETEYKELDIIKEAKRLQGLKVDLADKLELARKGAKAIMMRWEDEEERKLKEKEMRLALEAKQRADEEAAIAAELKRKEAEKARKEAERAEAKGNAEKAILARQREESARAEELAIKQDAANAIAPVIVLEDNTPKTPRRMIPKFRIKNAAIIPREYLMPNEVSIGGVIRALRGAANIPGVEYYEEPA